MKKLTHMKLVYQIIINLLVRCEDLHLPKENLIKYFTLAIKTLTMKTLKKN